MLIIINTKDTLSNQDRIFLDRKQAVNWAMKNLQEISSGEN